VILSVFKLPVGLGILTCLVSSARGYCYQFTKHPGSKSLLTFHDDHLYRSSGTIEGGAIKGEEFALNTHSKITSTYHGHSEIQARPVYHFNTERTLSGVLRTAHCPHHTSEGLIPQMRGSNSAGKNDRAQLFRLKPTTSHEVVVSSAIPKAQYHCIYHRVRASTDNAGHLAFFSRVILMAASRIGGYVRPVCIKVRIDLDTIGVEDEWLKHLVEA
jgi:hypothetical protein